VQELEQLLGHGEAAPSTSLEPVAFSRTRTRRHLARAGPLKRKAEGSAALKPAAASGGGSCGGGGGGGGI